MKELLNQFIVWYLIKKCNAIIEYNGKIVRVFSVDFYEKHITQYLNDLKRSDNNAG